MSIEMPRLLKNMNLFVDGRGYAGRVDEVENPKLSLKTEEHRAGGMDLPVEVELGMEKLEASLTFSDYVRSRTVQAVRPAGRSGRAAYPARRVPAPGRGRRGRCLPDTRRLEGNRPRLVERRRQGRPARCRWPCPITS